MTESILKGVGAGLGFAVLAPVAVAAWPVSLAITAVVVLGALAVKAQPNDDDKLMQQNLDKAAAVLHCNRMLEDLAAVEMAKVEARNRSHAYHQKLEELERIYAMGD